MYCPMFATSDQNTRRQHKMITSLVQNQQLEKSFGVNNIFILERSIMLRVLVNESGDCFGKFADGSSVFVASSCHITVETSNQNKRVTHLMKFINVPLKQKVSQIVRVRNTYFSPVSFPEFMVKADGQKKVRYLFCPRFFSLLFLIEQFVYFEIKMTITKSSDYQR